jgi:hypothetical protein
MVKFEKGKTYKTAGGSNIKVIDVSTTCVCGEDKLWRYNDPKSQYHGCLTGSEDRTDLRTLLSITPESDSQLSLF